MSFACIIACCLSFPFLITAQAIDLGTAATFGALGATTVTNVGASLVVGDVGVGPGNSITGFPPGNFTGTIYVNDGIATQAQADALTAYGVAAGLAPTSVQVALDLGGLTLTPGVYFFDTSAQLAGTLTLDAQGDPSALFVFQIGSTLTTASGSSILLINSAQPCNIIWQVGSSATLGTETTFVGIILAAVSISANMGVVNGSLIALTGAVTLQENLIGVVNTCAVIVSSTTTRAASTSITSISTASTALFL